MTCFSFTGSKPKQGNQSAMERAQGYYWYEAVFLDKQDVEKAFKSVSEDFPKYDVSPFEYHVTTEFKPNPKHEELYGSTVIIHITGYTYGSVPDTEEDIVSYNEGFVVDILSPDEKMQEYIMECDKIWHITGSYTKGGKYTEQLDFSDATPVDIMIKGVFGIGDSKGNIILENESKK